MHQPRDGVEADRKHHEALCVCVCVCVRACVRARARVLACVYVRARSLATFVRVRALSRRLSLARVRQSVRLHAHTTGSAACVEATDRDDLERARVVLRASHTRGVVLSMLRREAADWCGQGHTLLACASLGQAGKLTVRSITPTHPRTTKNPALSPSTAYCSRTNACAPQRVSCGRARRACVQTTAGEVSDNASAGLGAEERSAATESSFR